MIIEAIPSSPPLPLRKWPISNSSHRLSMPRFCIQITSYACKKGYITQSYCTPSFETN